VTPVQFLSPNLLGQGWEAGAKVELGQGRLLGTLSYFSNKEASRLDIDTANQVLYQLPGGTVRTAAGRSRTRGVETEWVWTPRLNYQALLSASYFFEKNEVSNPSNAREVGSHLESVPRYTVNLWNKYTFTDGALLGGYVGGGATALGETYEHPSWTVPIKSDAVVLFDAIVGYATKIGGVPVDLRVNIRNLADKHYLNGTFQYGEPRTIIGSVGLRL
jgi:iron complex outermembrane receptor protein